VSLSLHSNPFTMRVLTSEIPAGGFVAGKHGGRHTIWKVIEVDRQAQKSKLECTYHPTASPYYPHWVEWSVPLTHYCLEAILS